MICLRRTISSKITGQRVGSFALMSAATPSRESAGKLSASWFKSHTELST